MDFTTTNEPAASLCEEAAKMDEEACRKRAGESVATLVVATGAAAGGTLQADSARAEEATDGVLRFNWGGWGWSGGQQFGRF